MATWRLATCGHGLQRSSSTKMTHAVLYMSSCRIDFLDHHPSTTLTARRRPQHH